LFHDSPKLAEEPCRALFGGDGVIYNGYSSRILEKICACVLFDEPCLLVGDTGCGKTTLVQHCAQLFSKPLFVYNMNQDSDALDLIGGFKPMDIKFIIRKLLEKFLKLFERLASLKNNQQFLENLRKLY